MNLRSFEERTTRSKSPKRYSLNRKIKEKERKQIADCMEVSKQPSPFSSREIPVSHDGCGKGTSGYEMRKVDCDGIMDNALTSPSEVAVRRDQKSCYTGFIAPITDTTEKKNLYGSFCTPNDITTQHSAPVSPQPSVNIRPLMACTPVMASSPGDFRSIASQLKNNSSRKPHNPFYAQVPYTSCNPSYAHAQQLHGNSQGIQGLQNQNPSHNAVGGVHSTMLQNSNVPQGNHPFVQSYMTPIQSTGFQFSENGILRGSEAYNAFTAYGNPFGIFWSRQN